MKKIFLILIIPFLLFARAYNQDEICKEVDLVMKEARMIYKKFKDPKNASILLGASAFRNITYRKPDCMNEKKYINYMQESTFYMSRHKNNYNAVRTIETIIKKYPDNAMFRLHLGYAYEQNTHQNNRYGQKSDSRTKAIESYEKYIQMAKSKKLKVDKHAVAFVKSGGMKKVKSTWGKYLNPSAKIPKNKYKAFYIDTRNPKKVVASEIVKDISINYNGNQFFNIESSNFGAYWVGNIEFKKDTKKMFYISQSNSSTRVIIDGYILFDGGNRASVEYIFKKGIHKIEVEHLNKWHTTNLVVKISPFIKKYNLKEIEIELKPLVKKNTQFYYISAYESSKKDNYIDLVIAKSKRSVILLLQSQRVVTWNIKNPYKTKIKAIVIHSNTPEATVAGEIKSIKILHAQRNVGRGYKVGLATKRDNNCRCISGHFSCGGGGASFNADAIPQLFSKRVRGFSGEYAVKILSVPEVLLSDKKYQEIKDYKSKIDTMRASCRKNKTVKIDELFK